MLGWMKKKEMIFLLSTLHCITISSMPSSSHRLFLFCNSKFSHHGNFLQQANCLFYLTLFVCILSSSYFFERRIFFRFKCKLFFACNLHNEVSYNDDDLSLLFYFAKVQRLHVLYYYSNYRIYNAFLTHMTQLCGFIFKQNFFRQYNAIKT